MKLARFIVCAVLVGAASLVHALEVKPYSAEALAAAEKAGQPVALHFHADWCPVCRAQENVFDMLETDPEFAMTLLVVDYDKERELKRRLNVATQSTLIVFRGTAERSRSTGEKSAEKLKAVLRTALN